MKVSICIVTRNRSDSLRRTILSILASSVQDTFGDFEILVIDNSKPDVYLSNKLICNYDPRIKQISSNSKIGIAALRQIGVEESCGEVVAFIDDDIVIPRKWFSTMVDAFQSNKHLGIYGCNIQNIGFDGKVIGYETQGLPKKNGINGSFKPTENEEEIVTFGESNLVLRKEDILEAGGFDKRFKWGHEGADLTQEMLSKGCTIHYAKDIVVKHYYNQHRSRPGIDRSEYYRLLFFFKHFERKQFSLRYELKRIYYFLNRGYVLGAIYNVLLLSYLPLILLEAKRR